MNCEKCGKSLDVKKEGDRLCLSCQADYVNDKWKTKLSKIEVYENINKGND